MATYTKGFKKVQSDQTLLKAIVGIIAMVLLVVGGVFIYDLSTDIGDYTDFTAVHITKWDDVLTQKDPGTTEQVQDYVVYFYNAEQEDCLAVQKRVLDLAANLNSAATVVYFVDLEAITAETTGDDDQFLLDISKTSLFLNKSPMLVSVANGVFSTAYEGGDAVLEALNNIKTGDYIPFND